MKTLWLHELTTPEVAAIRTQWSEHPGLDIKVLRRLSWASGDDLVVSPTVPSTKARVLHLPRPLNLVRLEPEIQEYAATALLQQCLRGTSTRIQQARSDIECCATAEHATVLLTGETGTGKSVAAELIHQLSSRHSKPLVTINCGAIPHMLLESELFGHVKGAFTDAKTDHKGLIAEANGGTLFLDEINSMPPALQVKLLTFLESRTYRPVGNTKTYTSDARIIAASNTNLEHAAAQGTFRIDLYYRLNVLNVHMPSLRDIPDDIIPMAELLRQRFNERYGQKTETFTDEAFAQLTQHSWPGNVRELRNVVERAVILSRSSAIPLSALRLNPAPPLPTALPTLSLAAAEARYLQSVLDSYPNKTHQQIATLLGISRKTLFNKRQRYNL